MHSGKITHLRVECIRLWRNPWHMMSTVGGAFMLYLLIRFGLPPHAVSSVTIPATLLGVMVISLVQMVYSAFDEDYQTGRMMQWCYGGTDAEWLVVTKWLAYTLCCLLPMSVMFTLILWQMDDALPLHYAVAALCLCGEAVIACGLFGAVMSVCFRASQLSAYVLTLPFVFPLIMFGAQAMQGSYQAMSLLGAYVLFIIPVGLFMAARLLRYATL